MPYVKNGKSAKSMDALNMRRRLGLKQSAFWSRIGVKQSGGSRYERGRPVPLPVAKLLELAYGDSPLQTLKRLRGGP